MWINYQKTQKNVDLFLICGTLKLVEWELSTIGTAIVITSGKGGTGKTSMTAGIAVALSQMGRQVLCIDMDIGLRNLDLSLGLSDRALMDFSDVALGRCSLTRGAVAHPDLLGLSLLTAPLSIPRELEDGHIKQLISDAKTLYDYVFIDCPAGLETGFRFATCAADRALVVATCDASSLRDAQRVVTAMAHLPTVHLIMNRIQPKLLRKLRTTIDDAMDSAGLPLIGVVPEDPKVTLCANGGKPLTRVTGRQGAAAACRNMARRLEGYNVPILKIR